MTDLQDFPEDYLSQRLAYRPVADPALIPFLDKCLRDWGGVSYDEATVGDMLRASRAAAAGAVKRSPTAARVMADRTGFTSAELLRAMSKANRS